MAKKAIKSKPKAKAPVKAKAVVKKPAAKTAVKKPVKAVTKPAAPSPKSKAKPAPKATSKPAPKSRPENGRKIQAEAQKQDHPRGRRAHAGSISELAFPPSAEKTSVEGTLTTETASKYPKKCLRFRIDHIHACLSATLGTACDADRVVPRLRHLIVARPLSVC